MSFTFPGNLGGKELSAASVLLLRVGRAAATATKDATSSSLDKDKVQQHLLLAMLPE
jgi:hypothetical protein